MDNTLLTWLRRPPVIARHGIGGGCDWWGSEGSVQNTEQIYGATIQIQTQRDTE